MSGQQYIVYVFWERNFHKKNASRFPVPLWKPSSCGQSAFQGLILGNRTCLKAPQKYLEYHILKASYLGSSYFPSSERVGETVISERSLNKLSQQKLQPLGGSIIITLNSYSFVDYLLAAHSIFFSHSSSLPHFSKSPQNQPIT